MNKYEVTLITKDETKIEFETKANNSADLFANINNHIDLENIQDKTIVDIRAQII